jgi:uncharacterized protein
MIKMFFKLRPTYIIEHVTAINFEDLIADGIKGLIFDLDNTIMKPKTGKLSDDIRQWLEKAKETFKIVVVSNNPHKNYIENVEKELGIPIYYRAKKPRRGVTLKAIKDMKLLPSEVAMIGDRTLTDIFVGQRIGLVTILVDPLMKYQESAFIRFCRKFERLFIHPAKKIFSNNNRG